LPVYCGLLPKCNAGTVKETRIVRFAEGRPRIVRVSIDVDAGRSRLSVRAGSIRRAMEVAEEQNLGCALRVVFPLDPETFFVRDDAAEVVEIAA
jgi:hypothetical protein